MTDREAGKERLYPSIFGRMATRYYYLRQLRQKIEEVIAIFVKNTEKRLVLADYGCGNKPYQPLIAPFVSKYIGIDLPENDIADIHITPEGEIEMDGNFFRYCTFHTSVGACGKPKCLFNRSQ